MDYKLVSSEDEALVMNNSPVMYGALPGILMVNDHK